MKSKKWMHAIVIGCTVLALTACSSKHKRPDAAAIDDANAAYNDGAQSSGLGEDSRFGDEANGGSSNDGDRLSANKRTYYFDFDSDTVHDEDRPAIDANANRLARNGSSKAMLEGHTDPRGSREYNIGLGERRAKSVAEVMTARGVRPSQVRIVSYGAEKLASNGHSDSDYQLDRRVVLVDQR